MNPYNSFLFKERWMDAIDLLDRDSALELYNAISHYAFYGRLTELTSLAAKVAFALIRRDIDDANRQNDDTDEIDQTISDAQRLTTTKDNAAPCPATDIPDHSESTDVPDATTDSESEAVVSANDSTVDVVKNGATMHASTHHFCPVSRPKGVITRLRVPASKWRFGRFYLLLWHEPRPPNGARSSQKHLIRVIRVL